MNIFKRLKEKHPDIWFLYAFVISLIVLAIFIALVFTIPSLLKAKNPPIKRIVSFTPASLKDDTSLDPLDSSMTLTYEAGKVKDNIKFSSNASSNEVGPYNADTYLFGASDSINYTIEIEYTVTGLKFKDMSVIVTLCDDNGLNETEISEDQYSFILFSNGGLYSYSSSGDTYIKKVEITYLVI